MSGVALLDKSGWAPLGAGKDDTHPVVVALVGLSMVVLVPLVWGLIRRTEGMPMFGAPTVAELEDGDEALRAYAVTRRRGRVAGPVSGTPYHR